EGRPCGGTVGGGTTDGGAAGGASPSMGLLIVVIAMRHCAARASSARTACSYQGRYSASARPAAASAWAWPGVGCAVSRSASSKACAMASDIPRPNNGLVTQAASPTGYRPARIGCVAAARKAFGGHVNARTDDIGTLTPSAIQALSQGVASAA